MSRRQKNENYEKQKKKRNLLREKNSVLERIFNQQRYERIRRERKRQNRQTALANDE